MSEPHDPDVEYRALIRAEHDRQRRKLIAALPLAAGGPGLLVAFAAVLMGAAQGIWMWVSIAGGALATGLILLGMRLLGRTEPSDDTLRLARATPWFEEIQRGRTTSMLYMFILIFGLMPMNMGAAWDVVTGDGNVARAINAAVGLLLVLMPMMILSGRDGSIMPKLRKYLDDEHTRDIRKRAMSSGFVVLMLGATAVYLLGLWRQESAVVMILPVMSMAAFVAVGRFALLERAAERGDGEDG